MSITNSNCDTMEYVFVYGSLRKGFWNHEAYLKDSKFIGRGKTKEKYASMQTSSPMSLRMRKSLTLLEKFMKLMKKPWRGLIALKGIHTSIEERKFQ